MRIWSSTPGTAFGVQYTAARVCSIAALSVENVEYKLDSEYEYYRK